LSHQRFRADKNQKKKNGLHISTAMSHAMQQVVFLISTSPGRQDRIIKIESSGSNAMAGRLEQPIARKGETEKER
jgi:hypothetical protein